MSDNPFINNGINMNTKALQKKGHRVFLESDLVGTRFMIGLSSFIFSMVMFIHAIQINSVSDFIVSAVSFFHCSCIGFSLYTNIVSRIIYIGEAMVGFLLWNIISMDTLYLQLANFPENAFSAPIIVISIATWWIMARYPTTYNNKKLTAKNDNHTIISAG